jgi:hypothetical protein
MREQPSASRKFLSDLLRNAVPVDGVMHVPAADDDAMRSGALAHTAKQCGASADAQLSSEDGLQGSLPPSP